MGRNYHIIGRNSHIMGGIDFPPCTAFIFIGVEFEEIKMMLNYKSDYKLGK